MNTYYYKLKGKARKLCKEYYEKKQSQKDHQIDEMHKWCTNNGFDTKYWADDAVVAIKIPESGIPAHFKKSNNRCPDNTMCPRLSTKEGKDIKKFWDSLKVTVKPQDLFEHLNCENAVFGSMALMRTRAMFVNGQAFLIIGKHLDHKEVTEVTLGYLEEQVKKHNKQIEDGVSK